MRVIVLIVSLFLLATCGTSPSTTQLQHVPASSYPQPSTQQTDAYPSSNPSDIPTTQNSITREDAIMRATLIAQTSEPELAPSAFALSNITAEFVTLKVAAERLQQIRSDIVTFAPTQQMVWLVTMDGAWSGMLKPTCTTERSCYSYQHSAIILDAQTGERLYRFVYP